MTVISLPWQPTADVPDHSASRSGTATGDTPVRQVAPPGREGVLTAFDRARLAPGCSMWLRRQRGTSTARTRLRSARNVFARSQALFRRDWARAELRATGTRVPDGATVAAASAPLFLSAREQRIARSAATGPSHREIAERLLIPPPSVGRRRELNEVLREFGGSA
ncbi:hypothetical protein ACIBQ5_36520 [Streptomyces massasporeus]|uniref:hypothetical protein n=1 Tax=Streptomyces massasporeus TaxID=67324 RepID=UPI00378D51C2